MNTHLVIGGRACVLVAALALGACSEQELYSGLSEQDANEMVATLYEADLPGSKTRSADGLFAVSTSRESFAGAVGVLKVAGFPRVRYDSLGEVFAKEGFVSSPLEERARLNHAMSQEIAHTISRIDGVLVARVHLAVPEPDELTDTVRPASASVFVKHRANVDLSGNVGQIKALVVNGMENLPYEQVTVALFAAEASGRSAPRGADDPVAMASAVGTGAVGTLPLGVVGAAFGGFLLALVVGAVVLLRRRDRSGAEVHPSAAAADEAPER